MLFLDKVIWSSRGTITVIGQMTTLSDKLVKNLPEVTQVGSMELGWVPSMCGLDHYTHSTTKEGGGRVGA